MRRILNSNKLKPWRHHLWLSPKAPRDAAFVQSIKEISCLYTRPLNPDEMVLCVDEKTNLQPRPRKAKTLPAKPELPIRVEHEYERKGALNLFAAFDTRSGKVWGQTYERKRQEEFIAFLEYLDIADFADKQALSQRLSAFIHEWNVIAHPFNWSQKSTTKILAKCEIVNSDNTTKILDAKSA